MKNYINCYNLELMCLVLYIDWYDSLRLIDKFVLGLVVGIDDLFVGFEYMVGDLVFVYVLL